MMGETALLVFVRLAYFLACRHYVNAYLFADLKDVLREDGLAEDDDTQDGDAVRLDDAENGMFGGGGAAAMVAKARDDRTGSSLLPVSTRRPSDPPRRDSTLSLYGRTPASRAYSTLSTALFCLSFSESSMLFTLLLFGDAVSERCARPAEWSSCVHLSEPI